MLTNFFRKSKPISFIAVLIFFLCFYIIALIAGKINFQFSTFPLFLIVFGIVNFIILKNNLTFDNWYAFLFFALLFGYFPQMASVEKAFVINLTLLLLFRKIYSFKSSKKLFQKLFDAGLWLGVSFLMEPFSIVFFFLLYACVFLHQRITPRTLLIPILGFLAPVILYFTYCFWNDKMDAFYKLSYWYTSYDFSLYQLNGYSLSILIIGLLVLISIAFKTPKVLPIKNKFRLNWMLILLHFALAILLTILTRQKNGSEFLYILLPTSIILANGFELIEKKWFSDIILISFILGAFIVSVL